MRYSDGRTDTSTLPNWLFQIKGPRKRRPAARVLPTVRAAPPQPMA